MIEVITFHVMWMCVDVAVPESTYEKSVLSMIYILINPFNNNKSVLS